jgi:methyl-accepting chemotaxis protein
LHIKKSLTHRTILKIAILITLVILITTLISYIRIYSSLETQVAEQLDKYVTERVQRERNVFTLATDNEASLKKEFLDEYQSNHQNSTEIEAAFDKLFVKQVDGAIRNRTEIFNGTRQAGVWIAANAPLTDDVRLRITLFYNLATQFGPAWHNRFQDTYFMSPENMTAIYWPEHPAWTQDAKADFQMLNQEYYYVADQTHDPTQATVWTGVYYDVLAKVWLVSCETPVDVNGQQIATVGEDLTVNQLLDRAINDHLNNGYNVIFRPDGRLIAHPDLMDQIRQNGGTYNLNQVNNPQLQQIAEQVKKMPANQVVINDEQNDQYLAAGYIPEPGWYFVTVIPKSVITAPAFNTAGFVLLVSIVALIVELAVLYIVLQNEIATPLLRLNEATQTMAAGNLAASTDKLEQRQDELGRLAQSFNIMAQAIAERDERMSLASQRVLSGATQLRATSQQQVSGSQAQVIAITEVNTAVTKLSATAHHIYELAEKVKERASRVTSDSEIISHTTDQVVLHSSKGIGGVELSLTTSQEVVTLYQELLTLTENLKTKKENISRILSLLGAIAQETHLLSLNAAIEAASAGEFGERFNVVAQEVKMLARNSAAANREVEVILSQIEIVTNEIVGAIQRGYTKITDMQAVTHQTGTVIAEMRTFVEQSQLQTTLIYQTAQDVAAVGKLIENGTQQQNEASQQVLDTITALSTTASQHAASSAEVSVTASELEDLSRHLNQSLMLRHSTFPN